MRSTRLQGVSCRRQNSNKPAFGGATVAGNVVFTSTLAGTLVAFDRASGAKRWSWQAPGGINGLLAVAGETLLVPVGMANPPQLVALKIGASGVSLKEHQL